MSDTETERAEEIDYKALLAKTVETLAEQQRLVTRLLAGGGGHGNVPLQPTVAEIRRDKLLKLFPLLQKSQKVKDYKEGQEEPFRKWFDRYNTD